MRRVVLKALFSHWRRNPIQLFALVAGLALATALWSGVQAINAEARASYAAASATLGEGRLSHLRRHGGASLTETDFVILRRAGWLVSPVVEGRFGGKRLIGLDPFTAPNGLAPISLAEQAQSTSFLDGNGQIFGTADALMAIEGLVKADFITSPDMAPDTLLTDISLAQDLLGKTGQFDRFILHEAQPKRQEPLENVAPDLVVVSPSSNSDIGRLTDSFHLNLTAFGLLSFAVGIFIVNGAVGLAFEQRRPVIRTMRALGVPLKSLIVLIGLELMVLAALAGTLGVMLGYLVASALLPDVAATLRGLYGADVSGVLQLRPIWWVSGLLVAVIGALFAGAGAFYKLAKMPLLASASLRALVMTARWTAKLQAAVSVFLLALALILAISAKGLIAGFVLLAALLIGAALALPIILNAVLNLFEMWATSAKLQWFWADTRQQLPGLSLALMALLLAMAANVGVSTMVSSFRVTFTDFLDQRLASELYLNAEDVEQADALIAFVSPRVDAVLPIQSIEQPLLGLPTEIFWRKRSRNPTRQLDVS